MNADEFMERLAPLVDSAKKPINSVAKSAMQHVKMAGVIKDIDPTMSAFRMITAEEEAATAIIRSLKAQRYLGAGKLNHKRHAHKLGVYPFIKVIQLGFAKILEAQQAQAEVVVMNFEGKDRVRIELSFKAKPEQKFLPIPPLNFQVTNELNGQPYEFRMEIEDFVKKNGVNSVLKHIQRQFEFRNLLLYATDKGVATVKPSDHVYENRKERVLTMLCIYLMIDPYFEKQQFVQTAVNQFLDILSDVPKELEANF